MSWLIGKSSTFPRSSTNQACSADAFRGGGTSYRRCRPSKHWGRCERRQVFSHDAIRPREAGERDRAQPGGGGYSVEDHLEPPYPCHHASHGPPPPLRRGGWQQKEPPSS